MNRSTASAIHAPQPRHLALPTALLLIAAVAKLPTLSQPLTENFAWRQTQTAWTARIFHEQGIDLFHPEVPVHGPPWVFGFEFPLFQAFGAILMDLGVPPDLAMRTLGLITFLATGWLLYRLALRVSSPIVANAALAAFLFSPFGLLWGRTSLIEYLATAAALGYLLVGIRWLDGRRPLDFGLALIAGSAAVLVKITTGAFYLLPLLAYRSGERPVLLRDWSVAALVAVPSLLGLAWTAYIDAVKAASPATAFLTTSQLTDFNFGTLGMRVDLDVLVPIAAAVFVGLTGAGIWIWAPAGIAYVRRLPQGLFLSVLVALVLIGPPLVLTPLYSTQNYYAAAISPVAALLVGLGFAWAWERRHAFIGRLALVSGTALWAAALILTSSLWTMGYEPIVDRDGSLAAATYIRDRTAPADWVVVGGRYWDPAILYYADRRGYMLDERRGGVDDLRRLRSDKRYTLFVNCPYEAACTEMSP
jgi:hypothetical protein